jgi:dTDP-4-dehydrorhamnose 3,5-epimerase
MIFLPLALEGVYIVEPELLEDNRGFFARTFCQREFLARGLVPSLAQCNISFNKSKGTVRGMHYQTSPYGETKLVRCTMGAVYDVIIDIRKEAATFGRWLAVELTDKNRKALYIPEGLAHGFQTLVDETEVFYQMSHAYCPEASRGIRWNDPFFGISWPIPSPVLSDKDRSYPLFRQNGASA